MTEFIFKKDLFTNADPEKDRRGVHKPGDCVGYRPDGWSAGPNWAASKHPERFVVIKCPGITLAEAQAADYSKGWKDNFDYEILSQNATQGLYTVRVFETNVSLTGKNAMTREKVEAWLMRWGCSNISVTTSSVQFDFALWAAVRSEGFWNIPLLGTKVSFSLNSYNSTTGVGNITATLIDPSIRIVDTARKIEEQGGIVGTITETTIQFTIERSVVLQHFRDDVKRRLETTYKRHQHSISITDLDAVVSAGGIVTVSRSVFLSKIINHLDS
jgi:hypothetical protein